MGEGSEESEEGENECRSKGGGGGGEGVVECGRARHHAACRCTTAQFTSLLVVLQVMKLLQKASDARDVRKVCACVSLCALRIVYMFQSHSQTVVVWEWGWYQ